jgi:hypothetical protein
MTTAYNVDLRPQTDGGWKFTVRGPEGGIEDTGFASSKSAALNSATAFINELANAEVVEVVVP